MPPNSHLDVSVPPRKGRPPRITFHDVLTVASELSSAGGVDHVTIRGVAERLGTTRAAIYHYVGGTAELRRLVAAASISRFDFVAPDSARWQDWLRAFALALRSWRLERADADPYLYLSADVLFVDGFLAPIESVLGVMEEAGFSAEHAVPALQFLAGVVWINTQDQIMAMTSDGGAHPQRVALLEDAAEWSADHPRVAAALDHVPVFDRFDQRFETEIRWVITSLEAELATLRSSD